METSERDKRALPRHDDIVDMLGSALHLLGLSTCQHLGGVDVIEFDGCGYAARYFQVETAATLEHELAERLVPCAEELPLVVVVERALVSEAERLLLALAIDAQVGTYFVDANGVIDFDLPQRAPRRIGEHVLYRKKIVAA